MLIGYGFLKCEVAEALDVSGCIASYGGDAYHQVDCLSGDEPLDEGVEVQLDTVPDVINDVLAAEEAA